MRQTNVRGTLSLRGFRKLRTGAIVATGVILLGLGFLAPTVSASEQDGVWVARTVEEVKADIQNIDNLSHYTIKWGDTLSAISGATGLSVDSLVEINRIANRDLIFANNKLYFSEEAFLKDGNTEVKRQRVSIDNSGSCQSYEVETKTNTVTGEQTTTVKQTTPVVVETPAVSPALKAETPVTVAPKSDESATPALKTEEPSAPAPKSEEPEATTPQAEEPATPAPKAEEPMVSEPKVEEPVSPAPKVEEPMVSEPKAEEPVSPAPKVEEPTVSEPKAEAPVATRPTTAETGKTSVAPSSDSEEVSTTTEETGESTSSDSNLVNSQENNSEVQDGTTNATSEEVSESKEASTASEGGSTATQPAVEAGLGSEVATPGATAETGTTEEGTSDVTPGGTGEASTESPEAEVTEPEAALKEDKSEGKVSETSGATEGTPGATGEASETTSDDQEKEAKETEAEEPTAETETTGASSTTTETNSGNPETEVEESGKEPENTSETANTPSTDATTDSNSVDSSPVTETGNSEATTPAEPKAEDAMTPAPKKEESGSSVESPSPANHSEESPTVEPTISEGEASGESTEAKETPEAPKVAELAPEGEATGENKPSTSEPTESPEAKVTEPKAETPEATTTGAEGKEAEAKETEVAPAPAVENPTASEAGNADKTSVDETETEEAEQKTPEVTSETSTTPSADATNESGKSESSPSVIESNKEETNSQNTEVSTENGNSESSNSDSEKPQGDEPAVQVGSEPTTEVSEVPESTTTGEEGKSETTEEISNNPSTDATPSNDETTEQSGSSVPEAEEESSEVVKPAGDSVSSTSESNEDSNLGNSTSSVSTSNGKSEKETSGVATVESGSNDAKPSKSNEDSSKVSKEETVANTEALESHKENKISEIQQSSLSPKEKQSAIAKVDEFTEKALKSIKVASTSEEQAKAVDQYEEDLLTIDTPGAEYASPDFKKPIESHTGGTTIDENSTVVNSALTSSNPSSQPSSSGDSSQTQPAATSDSSTTGNSGFRSAGTYQPRVTRRRRSIEEPQNTVSIYYNFDGMKDIPGFLGDPGEKNDIEIPKDASGEKVKSLIKEKIDAKKSELAKRGYQFSEDIFVEYTHQDATHYDYVVTFTKEKAGTTGFRIAPKVQVRAKKVVKRDLSNKTKHINVYYNLTSLKDIAGALGEVGENNLLTLPGNATKEDIKKAVAEKTKAQIEKLKKQGFTVTSTTDLDQIVEGGDSYDYVVEFTKESETQPVGTTGFRKAPLVQRRAKRSTEVKETVNVNIYFNLKTLPGIAGALDVDGETTIKLPKNASEKEVKEAIKAKIAKVENRGYKVSDSYFGAKTEKGYDYVVEFTKEAKTQPVGASGFRMAPAVQPRASRNRRSLEQSAPQKVKVNVFYNFDKMKDIAGFLGDINGTPLEIAEGSTDDEVKAAVKNQVDAKKEELRKRGYTVKEDYLYKNNGKDYNYVVTFSKATK